MKLLGEWLPEGSVPRVRFADDENFAFGMTCAPDGGVLWKQALLDGHIDQQTAARAGALLADMHNHGAEDQRVRTQFESRTNFIQGRVDPYHWTTAKAHPDLAPIIEVSTLPFMLVAHPSLGVNNLRELIALAKREPGRINYASVGNGSGVHLATEMLKKQAGISLTHIPYKGSAPALTDVLAGTTPLMFVNLLSGLPHVKSGKLRVLAVGTPARLAALPDVPTVAEAGLPGYEFQVWIGIVAPAGTPATVVDRLNSEIRAAVAVPEIRDQLVNEGGMQIVGNSPAQFGAHIAADLDLWRKVVKDTGAKLD